VQHPLSDEEETPLSEWEVKAISELEAAHLPRWESKARAATYTQGHRGLLDLDLNFPEEYLRGPAPECYVWKTEVEDGTRVHAYADVEGNHFHLVWAEVSKTGPQDPPVHESGSCARDDCLPCKAAGLLVELCKRAQVE
jgi:hypothetical protein